MYLHFFNHSSSAENMGFSIRPLPTPNNLLTIEFPRGWGVGPVFDWYRGLSARLGETLLNRLQIRKDTRGVVPHRFIVLYMQDGSVHRFDRRPDMTTDNTTGLDLLLKDRPVPSKDECIRNLTEDARMEVETETVQEIELKLDGKVDLEVILTACFAISKDPSAHRYTLYAYNCFFFSWTILMVTSRHCLPYEIPSPEVLLQRAQTSHLPQVTNFIIDEAAKLFLDLAGDTVTIFRNKSGQAMYQGFSPFTQVTWALPMNFLRFISQQIFRAKMHFGLRKQLERQIADVVEKKAVVLCRQALAQHNKVSLLLDKHLWLCELDKIVGPALRAEAAGILRRAIFDAICSGYEDVDPSMLVQEVMNPSLKFALLGKRVTQSYAVWNAALYGGLRAARQAVQQEEEEIRREKEAEISPLATTSSMESDVLPALNEKIFDLAWKSAGTGALQAAQAVVNDTRTHMKDMESRDRMWNEIWKVWSEAWAEAQEITQKKLVGAVDRMVRKVLEARMNVVIEELGDASARSLEVHVRCRIHPHEKGKSESRQSHRDTKMTNAALQDLMQAIMKKDTFNNEKLEYVRETMSRIWKKARKLPGLKENDKVGEGNSCKQVSSPANFLSTNACVPASTSAFVLALNTETLVKHPA
uniref:Uncharacterized protein n=1 Tax=Moniliophthora roreri TaxID=221103 RepID=A0A0W0G7X4_MONRR